MHLKKMDPAAKRADRARNLISLAASINSENSASDLARQALTRRFHISAHLAAVIAELAGLGSREARQ